MYFIDPYKFPNFSPPDLTGLQMWFDITQETGYANDDAVTTWQDWSGNNRDATAPGNEEPLYNTNILNGKAGLWFDVDTANMTTGYNSGATFTMYLVEKGYSSVAYARSVNSLNTDPGDCVSISPREDGNNAYVMGTVSSYQATMGAPHYCCLKSNGATKYYWVDGTDRGSASNSNSLSNICFGACNTYYGSEGANAHLFEFILYNTSHSDTDRIKVQDYLASKWAILP